MTVAVKVTVTVTVKVAVTVAVKVTVTVMVKVAVTVTVRVPVTVMVKVAVTVMVKAPVMVTVEVPGIVCGNELTSALAPNRSPYRTTTTPLGRLDSLLTQRPAGLSMSAMRIRLPVNGCLLLSVVCLSSIASAQTNWERTYGGAGNDYGYSVQQTSDGGYVIAGHTRPLGSGEAYLVKTNAQGDTLWTRTYGSSGGAVARSVRQTSDGGYIIAGISSGTPNAYLIKTDAQGDTLWTRAYGDTHYSYIDDAYSAAQTSDGGYIIAGKGFRGICLLKTDAAGETLWTRTYGGTVLEFTSVQQTADGGYVTVGLNDGIWLIKTNATGDTLWTRIYGDGRACSAQQTTDGGYIVSGETASDACLIKTDAQGNVLWARTYSSPGYSVVYSVQQTADGGYIGVGFVNPGGAGAVDVYLIKTDARGDTLWTRTYGGTGSERCMSVQQTTDGSYIVVGETESFGAGDYDVYVIKTNPDPDVGRVAILSPPGIVDSGQVYVPSVVVRNFGLGRVAFPVTISIGTAYAQTVQETLASEVSDTVVFPAWIAEPVGSLAVTCFTSLPGDMNPANDTIRDTIQVLPPPFHDVGAVAIVLPSGSVRAGDTVMPRARVRNYGNRVERYFDVRFRIGTSYNEKVNVAVALPADSAAELTFPPWVAETGDWAVSCSTMLAIDEDSSNDEVGSSVHVSAQTLRIEPDQSHVLQAGENGTYQFYALLAGDTGGVVAVPKPSSPPGWSARLCDATGANDLTDTDGDGVPDLGYVAPGESGWFSLDVTAPSGTQGDTASLGQGVFFVAGHVGGRPDIADTAVLSLTLLPAFSVHNFPNPFSDHTAFVVGLPDEGKVNLTIYTRTGERVCRVMENRDMPAGVHLIRWDGVNDNGRRIAPGTYEYLLDYVHAGKTDRIRKRLVLTRQ